MKKWFSLMALMLCAAILLSSIAVGASVDNEIQCTECGKWFQEGNDFDNHICDDSWAGGDGGAILQENGYVQCDDCGGWYMNGNDFRNHICEADEPWEYESTDGGVDLLEEGYVQCDDCGGWYMNGNDFRNHLCTFDPTNPSSSWTSPDEYYDWLVAGKLDTDQVTAIGELYVSTANGKSLNLRTRPSTKGEIQCTIPNGAAVTLFWYENSSWAFVAYRSYFGFCMTRHLTDKVPGTSQNETKADDTSKMYNGFKHVDYDAVVKPTNPTGYVNMRWAPSKSTDVQGIYYANTVLHVIATNGTWSQVYDPQTNQCGFMMNAYLTKLLN